MRFWLSLAVTLIASIASTYAAARWLRDDGRTWLLWSYLTAEICTVAWYIGASGASPGLARISIICPMTHLAVGVLIGVVVAGDKLTGRLMLALVLAVVAVILASEPKTEQPL